MVPYCYLFLLSVISVILFCYCGESMRLIERITDPFSEIHYSEMRGCYTIMHLIPYLFQ